MPDPNKSLWRDMHQKTSDEFDTGKGKFFPLPFVPVIFHGKCDSFFVYTDDPVVTDRNPMSILSEIFNYRLGTMKCLFAIRNPLCTITCIQKFLESIMVTEHFRGTMKNQLIPFPQGFEFLQIFSTEHFGNDLNGKEEAFSFVSPLIIRGQASTKKNGMDMGMEVHLRSPCVEDEDIANFCAEMSGVFHDIKHHKGASDYCK